MINTNRLLATTLLGLFLTACASSSDNSGVVEEPIYNNNANTTQTPTVTSGGF